MKLSPLMQDFAGCYQIKKRIDKNIELLLENEELNMQEFENKVKKEAKLFLPNASMYLLSIISNYAKTIRIKRDWEASLYREISKYKNNKDNKIVF